MCVLYVRVVDPVWAVPASSPKRLRGVSGRAGGLVWRRRDLGPQSPAHRGNVVVVAVSEEASVGGGPLGRPPLMPPARRRAVMANIATASPTFACSQQVPPDR